MTSKLGPMNAAGTRLSIKIMARTIDGVDRLDTNPFPREGGLNDIRKTMSGYRSMREQVGTL